jgi:SAM-dependent methyltransferase
MDRTPVAQGVTVRRDCRACGSTDLALILDLGSMPLAGGFLSSREAAASERRFPLRVQLCRACGLLQILDVVDPEIMFQDYSFSSSTIGPLVEHFAHYADQLIERFRPSRVLEFGCNDGVLLSHLVEGGVQAFGVDPSRNITELARAKGLNVTTDYFTPEVATRLRELHGPMDIVTGSNVFAHNNHPELILSAARTALSQDGHLCLEVMYAADLLEAAQWDTLYHEHLTFYSLTSMERLLARHGFSVVDVEHVPMHGGALRVTASVRHKSRRSSRVAELEASEARAKIAAVETWLDFAERSRRSIRAVREIVGDLAVSRRIAAYGAAGKATMWLNACEMQYLLAVADASPLRAGKIMPGTHTPIVSPAALRDLDPDHIFITAWNYADNIRSKERWFRGLWSVPLPELRFF